MPQRNENNRITVFFDGNCPLCCREITFYKGRRGARDINWCDVSKAAFDEVTPGLTRSAAMTRFHVRSSDGSFVSGGDAFRALWRQLTLFRPIALLLDMPGLRELVNWSYDIFLEYRPALRRAVISNG